MWLRIRVRIADSSSPIPCYEDFEVFLTCSGCRCHFPSIVGKLLHRLPLAENQLLRVPCAEDIWQSLQTQENAI